ELKPEIALPILEGIVQSDTEMAVKVEAVEAIGNLPDKAGTHALERIAKSKLPAQVRREAIEALGNADPEAALPVLEEILGDKQPTRGRVPRPLARPRPLEPHRALALVLRELGGALVLAPRLSSPSQLG